MPQGFHPPAEEYLAALYEIGEEGTPAIQARLSERLGVTAPSVSEMVRRLEADGYLHVVGRDLRMTADGRRRAEAVVRKHRLAERLLTDVIGLPWHKCHLEAGRWEHVISDDVEAHLVELLGHPTTCPHGNPIPGTAGTPGPQRPLAVAEPGERVQLQRVSERLELHLETVTYLSEQGLVPGTEATVRDRGPDGTMTLDVEGRTVAVGASLAGQLYVSV